MVFGLGPPSIHTTQDLFNCFKMPEGTINYHGGTTMLGRPWLNICTTYIKAFGQKRLCHKTGRTPSLCQKRKKRCFNYCGISLFSIAGKVLTTIVRSCITGGSEANFREAQASFCLGDAQTRYSVFAKSLETALEMDRVMALYFFILLQLSTCSTRLPLGSNVDFWYFKKVSITKALYVDKRTWVRVY